MEKDKRIKENTLNCPSKRLRRRLWAVLRGYRWRRSRLVSWCRVRLPIIFYPSSDSSTHQRYINLVYNLFLVQFKSHTRPFWCFRWNFLNLYTSYTDKILTLRNSDSENSKHPKFLYPIRFLYKKFNEHDKSKFIHDLICVCIYIFEGVLLWYILWVKLACS
jgi:hypothetical protein